MAPTPRFLFAGALLALTMGASTPVTSRSDIKYTDTKLKNGLRVIIAEDHNEPVYSIAISYNVGSRDERKGRTGFAHLFEHMMFKGSENVGNGEYYMLVFNNGGNMNGTTNKDRTLYYETLPSNQLDLGLFLEADRMRSLVITKDNLDNQRNAVQEERRIGVENQPYGRTLETIDSLAFTNFAYSHSVIGSMADLSAASVEDVQQFFKTYYAPNNAVMAVVGDVKTADVLERIRKQFESIPSQPAPAPVDMTEPASTGEKRIALDDAVARAVRLDISYVVPPSSSDDDAALSVLATVLGGGRSSRFYEQVIRQQQLATNVTASKAESRGPGLFGIGITVAQGKPPADAEKAVMAEIEKIKAAPPADWEMDKAIANAQRNAIAQQESSLARAVLLSQYALFYNDPARINTRVARIKAVTAADVQRVAKQYLNANNRSVIQTNPKAAAPSRGGQ
ncbi:MAG: protease3 [Gemmatimonadetes bacterium]|nr:protease3 [Gemmatimonadota bacterium]